MRQWLNDGSSPAGGLGRCKDPLTGANDPETADFRRQASRSDATGFPRFVTTRGCAYSILPSKRLLRYLAATASA